jgi:hypothetical protein
MSPNIYTNCRAGKEGKKIRGAPGAPDIRGLLIKLFPYSRSEKKQAGHLNVPPDGVSGIYQTLLPQTLLPAIIRAMIIAMLVKWNIFNPFPCDSKNLLRIYRRYSQ